MPRMLNATIGPSGSVHTAFMRFPIDVVFLDRGHTVVKVAENVRPYRVALSRAHSAPELNAGSARQARLEQGDRLVIDDHPAIEKLEAVAAAVDRHEAVS